MVGVQQGGMVGVPQGGMVGVQQGGMVGVQAAAPLLQVVSGVRHNLFFRKIEIIFFLAPKLPTVSYHFTVTINYIEGLT